MGDRYKKSCLFLDFDNIFSGLRNQSDKAAEKFAKEPRLWIDWFEKFQDQEVELKRRILVKKCYINPKVYGEYRPYFVKSGFQVIDCPTLTSHGKNSADIYMVLDIIDFLQHEIHYDEFIIMSADSDFTPVIVKLKEYDRSTFVVITGNSSAAYQNSSDKVMFQSGFIDILEGINGNSKLPVPVQKGNGESKIESGKNSKGGNSYRKKIEEILGKNDNDMILTTLSQQLLKVSPEIYEENKWNGHNKFVSFIKSLEIPNIELDMSVPGYIRKNENKPVGDFDYNNEFLKTIHDICSIPIFDSKTYELFFNTLIGILDESEYSLTETSKQMRDKMNELDSPIGRNSVNFILIGLRKYNLKRDSAHDIDEMKRDYFSNLVDLISSSQIDISEDNEKILKQMLNILQ